MIPYSRGTESTGAGTKGAFRAASTAFDTTKDKTTFRSCLNHLGTAGWYFIQGTENQEGRKESHRLRLLSFNPNSLSFREFRAHGDH